MKRGQIVRASALGAVQSYIEENDGAGEVFDLERDPVGKRRLYKVFFGTSNHVETYPHTAVLPKTEAGNRCAFFLDTELELLDAKPLIEPEGWRGVCADMIRLGKDQEAVALLVEKAPSVVPYIKALEGLLEAFAKLPAEDAYERMVQRDAASSMWAGKIETREKIDAFHQAVTAWKTAMSIRSDH